MGLKSMSESPKEIKIDGLTDEQADMLDVIWSCDSYDELKQLMACLDERERIMATTLVTVIMHEEIEQHVIKPMKSYPDAIRIINKIKKKLN
jgi:lysyl-tRNA synthetase class I